MTDNDKFFERLREDAKHLRYEPADGAAWTRLAARVSERVHAQPTVSQFLARWLRPIGASVAALALAATIGVTWIETDPGPDMTVEAMAATPAVDVAFGE